VEGCGWGGLRFAPRRHKTFRGGQDLSQGGGTSAMAMKDTLRVLNKMVRDGVIARYAISGAVAAYYYVEASSTDDLDVLVSFDGFTTPATGLISLEPIVAYLGELGHTEWRKEGMVVEGWPVQFLPVSDDLSADALKNAITLDLAFTPGDGNVPVSILTAEHLIAIALQTGRAKDFNRIMQFVEAQSFEPGKLKELLASHGLMDKWLNFCDRFQLDGF
jgi:hypothetical protein